MIEDNASAQFSSSSSSAGSSAPTGTEFAHPQGSENQALKPLPASLEAEKGVISCLLRDPEDKVSRAIEIIGEGYEVFHYPQHRALFELLVDFFRADVPQDIVTISERITARKLTEKIGGLGYLYELVDYAPTMAHFDYYLEVLRDKYTLRQLIGTCTECVREAYDNPEEVAPLLDSVEQQVLAVREGGQKATVRTMKEEVLEAIKKIDDLSKEGGGPTGIPSGFQGLDDKTGGLNGSEMIVIAARPSMGKTSLMMNIVEHVVVEQNIPVAVFSLEMSTQSLVQRMLCSLSKINMTRLTQGMFAKKDRQRLLQGASQLAGAPLYIDDTPSLPIMELRAKARRLHKRHNIGLIAVDYLQLMRSNSKRAQDNRQHEIAEISSGLKAIAKELNIPVVVLAQLNRNPEQRSGKATGRPRLSDLRESGAIEQDADVVGLLVRTAYYADSEEDRQEAAGEAELIIAKQRNGPTGIVPLTFVDEYMRFEDRAFEGEEDYEG